MAENLRITEEKNYKKKLHNKLVAETAKKPRGLCSFHACNVTKSSRDAYHLEAKHS